MPEKVRMHTVAESSLLPILLHELLNPAWAVLPILPTLEQVLPVRMRLDMGAQHESHRLWKEHVTVLRSLALVDEYLAVPEVDVANLDVNQFVDPDGREQQKSHHDFVLGVLDALEERREIVLGQQLRRPPLTLWPMQAILFSDALEDMTELPVVNVMFADLKRQLTRYVAKNARFRKINCYNAIDGFFRQFTVRNRLKSFHNVR